MIVHSLSSLAVPQVHLPPSGGLRKSLTKDGLYNSRAASSGALPGSHITAARLSDHPHQNVDPTLDVVSMGI